MKFLLSAFAASMMLLAIACKRGNESSAVDAVSAVQGVQLEQLPVNNEKEEQQPPNQEPAKNANTDFDKKIVKTALIRVETEEYKNYNRQVHDLAIKWEGYIAREEESENEGRITNSLTIKVPVARFDEAVNSISLMKGKMLAKEISSQDVTGEVMDIRTRAEAKKRIRLRYLDMLNKAKNIEEIIQVEREINQIQEQIEAAEGRLNYLSHTTSYSTIELSFFQVVDPKAIDDPNPGFAKRLLLALNEGVKWLGNLVIFFATLWPLWLILAIGILIIKRMKLTSIKIKQ